jgi:hypothetical protein
MTDINESVVDVIQEGLWRPGPVTGKSGGEYRAWPPYGACRFNGIDVHDMGVRIEDSFLMTGSGPEYLSESVPGTVEGIEALSRSRCR